MDKQKHIHQGPNKLYVIRIDELLKKWFVLSEYGSGIWV